MNRLVQPLQKRQDPSTLDEARKDLGPLPRTKMPPSAALVRLQQLANDPGLAGERLQALASYADRHIPRILRKMNNGRSAVVSQQYFDKMSELEDTAEQLIVALAKNPNTPIALLRQLATRNSAVDYVAQNPAMPLLHLEDPHWMVKSFEPTTVSEYLANPSRRALILNSMSAAVLVREWNRNDIVPAALQKFLHATVGQLNTPPAVEDPILKRLEAYRWPHFSKENQADDFYIIRLVDGHNQEYWTTVYASDKDIVANSLNYNFARIIAGYYAKIHDMQQYLPAHKTLSVLANTAAHSYAAFYADRGRTTTQRVEAQTAPISAETFWEILIEQHYNPRVVSPKASAMEKLQRLASDPSIAPQTAQKLINAFKGLRNVDPEKGDTLFKTLAQNPNLTPLQALSLIDRYGDAVMSNPSTTLWSLENPTWVLNTWEPKAIVAALKNPQMQASVVASLGRPEEHYTFQTLHQRAPDKFMRYTGLDRAPQLIERWTAVIPDKVPGTDFSVMHSIDHNGDHHWHATESAYVSDADYIAGWSMPKNFADANEKARRFNFGSFVQMVLRFADQHFDWPRLRFIAQMLGESAAMPLQKRAVAEDFTPEMAKIMKLGPAKLTFPVLAKIHQAAQDPSLDVPSQKAMMAFFDKRGAWDSSLASALAQNVNLAPEFINHMLLAQPDAFFDNPMLTLWLLENPAFFERVLDMSPQHTDKLLHLFHQRGMLDKLAERSDYTFKRLIAMAQSPRYRAQYRQLIAKEFFSYTYATKQYGREDWSAFSNESPTKVLPERFTVWKMRGKPVFYEIQFYGSPKKAIFSDYERPSAVWHHSSLKNEDRLIGTYSDQRWNA